MKIIKIRVWNQKEQSLLKLPATFEQTKEAGLSYIPLYTEPGDLFVYLVFTGISDKNGVEVYEGDIVDCLERKGGEIKWSYKYLGWVVDFNGYIAPLYAIREIKDFEVVGNIFCKNA